MLRIIPDIYGGWNAYYIRKKRPLGGWWTLQTKLRRGWRPVVERFARLLGRPAACGPGALNDRCGLGALNTGAGPER